MSRLFKYLSILFTVLMVSCSGDVRVQQASEMGQKDARQFMELYDIPQTNELKLQDFLISVRVKENKLIEAGYEKAALKYIDAFKTTIQEENDSLYTVIFN